MKIRWSVKIKKKKRLTKAIEPLINKMNKNVKSGRNNNKQENEGGGADAAGSAGHDEVDQIGKWHASFVKSLKYVESDYYHDHCWQLAEDFIELRFYLERLHADLVEQPGKKRKILLKEAL